MTYRVHRVNKTLDVHCVNAVRDLLETGERGLGHLLNTEHESERIVLGVLSSVESDGARSQRRMAAELGIALGLVNAYLRRCIKKGLVKVHDAPARRYAYYLTPQGFAEKSRLTVQYLSHSFSFFRLAKSDCARVLNQAKGRGFLRVVLAGQSDLAEVAILCAVEAGVTVVALVDPTSEVARFVGVNVYRSYDEVKEAFDAVIVTDVVNASSSYDLAAAVSGVGRVLAPGLLGLRKRGEAAEDA
ncbi:winged helix-turn-helix transcriptional regulator [Bradyrhizobium vignae]|uniref:Winged helix-turn-helix transcriptional regulator n=1 Tax=Bradyrhizobium vignae TaxID=1549949 RepID=A0ABS3ZZZ9_9BRAD|nr:winged helix-turn-helix transcriptional regulator [Bradyrhizobium vignae]